MIYVYAPSMATLVYSTRIWDVSMITIITYNESILYFCEKATINYIQINSNYDNTFQGLLKHKKYINSFACNFFNKTFFFGHYSFDYWGLYLLKKLSKRNIIFFSNQDHPFNKVSFLNMIQTPKKLIKDLFILRSILGLPLSVFKISKDYNFLAISPSFFEKRYSLDKIPSNEIYNKNKDYFKKLFFLKDYKAIFIDQGDSRFFIPNEIINILTKKFNNNELIIKEHPNFQLSNHNLNHFIVAYKHIPVEFLINNKTIVIGIASTALIDAQSNLIISLIHLCNWKNQYEKQQYEKFLPKNVLKPKTLLELITMINK